MSRIYTDDEIVTSYRLAKNPAKQIPILAQLCGCPVEEIENIIRSCGFSVRECSGNYGKMPKISWTTGKFRELEHYLSLGMTEREISRAMRCTINAVRGAKSRLKKLKAAEKGNEPAPAGTDTSSKHNNTDIMIQHNDGFVKGNFYV